jgi:VanZ family protein
MLIRNRIYPKQLSKALFRAKWTRVAAWGCFAVLVYLSLIPSSLEVRTGLPSQIEHVIAYAGAAFLATAAYPEYSRAVVWLSFLSLAGLLEVGQHFVPGRHPQLIDFVAGGSGAAIGVFAASMLGAAGRGAELTAPSGNT